MYLGSHSATCGTILQALGSGVGVHLILASRFFVFRSRTLTLHPPFDGSNIQCVMGIPAWSVYSKHHSVQEVRPGAFSFLSIVNRRVLEDRSDGLYIWLLLY